MYPALVLALSYLVGAVPFANLFSRSIGGVDLRAFGSKTVSGSSLFKVAGFWPMAGAGVLDVAKGAFGPVIAGPGSHPTLGALAAGAAVVGHNWSPFLKGAGGRGVGASLGATAVLAWPGTVILAIGLASGKIAGQTGLGCFVAQALLTPLLGAVRGPSAALLGAVLVGPMLAKRVVGNERPKEPSPRTYINRLVFDTEAPAT